MKYLYIKLSVICTILLASCVNLDTEPQGIITSKQKEDVIRKSPEKINADIVGMFGIAAKQYAVFGANASRGDDWGYPGICLSQDRNGPDVVGLNLNYNWFGTSSAYSDRSDTYANPYIRYSLFYQQIKLANDILEVIPEDTDNAQMKIYIAQAKAVRAFDYLSLAPYFQYKYKGNEDQPSVPIVDPKRGNDANNPRAPLKELYEYIFENINYAIENLEGYSRGSKNEIDQKVAYGIRARANLYIENWADAAADAQKAMEGYMPYSLEDVSKPAFYNSNDQNYMWALIIKANNLNDSYICWPSWISSFGSKSYSTGGACWNIINVQLYNKIPDTDVRKGWWVNKDLESKNLKDLVWEYKDEDTPKKATGNEIPKLRITDVKEVYEPYTNVKFGYAGGLTGTTGEGDWCMMRTEEMILIRAEALAMSGDLAGGKEVLENFVKTYRNPEYTVQANTTASFQDEVWLQRRIELWGEGFSMSDIMRLGKPVVRFSPNKESNFPDAFKFNIEPNDPWLLQRFPQKETNNNPGIVQNVGGNQPKPDQNPHLTDGVVL